MIEAPNWLVRDAILDSIGNHDCIETKVFIVLGHCPPQNIPTEVCWIVNSFLSEIDAIQFTESLNQWCKDNKVHKTSERNPSHIERGIIASGQGVVSSGQIGGFPFASGSIRSGGTSIMGGITPPISESYIGPTISLGGSAQSVYSSSLPPIPKGIKCPDDPNFRTSYYGTEYYYKPVTLRI